MRPSPSDSRFLFRVMGFEPVTFGMGGCRMYSGLHMIARYQWKLSVRSQQHSSLSCGKCVAYFSFIGTTMYFFWNKSSFDVHLRTLWYPLSYPFSLLQTRVLVYALYKVEGLTL